jgi:hypothetical protein
MCFLLKDSSPYMLIQVNCITSYLHAVPLYFEQNRLMIMIFLFCNEISLLSVPPNGLVIYCGTIVTDEGKEKKVNIDFEPFRPINTSLYLCDNKVGVCLRVSCQGNVEMHAFSVFICVLFNDTIAQTV